MSKISGFWIGKHDLFEAHPDYSHIGRAENFFLAAAFAELLQVVITDEIKDMGSYVIPIWTGGAFYNRQLQKDKTSGYLYSVILSCLKPE